MTSPQEESETRFGAPLKNPEHEMYCRLRVLEGRSRPDAYLHSVAKQIATNTTREKQRQAASNMANRLENRTEVAERMESLKRLLIERSLQTTLLTKNMLEETGIQILERTMGLTRIVDRDGIQVVTHVDTVKEDDEVVGTFKSDYGNANKIVTTLLKMYGWDQAPPQTAATTPRNPALLRKQLMDQVGKLDDLIEKEKAN
jgi:hypothetical protein